MMNKLKQLLPSWYEGIRETDLLMEIEDGLLRELLTQLETIQANQYVSTADSRTITLYEKMLGITTNLLESLDARRFRVLTRLGTQKPYTKKYLEEMLSSFGHPVTLEFFYNEYRMVIESQFEGIGMMQELDYLIRTIVPANIMTEVNNHLVGSTSGGTYLACGLTSTELVTITPDYKANHTINQVLHVAEGGTVTVTEQLSADINRTTEVKTDATQANGVIYFESVEIY